jgi:hypothetical protein
MKRKIFIPITRSPDLGDLSRRAVDHPILPARSSLEGMAILLL